MLTIQEAGLEILGDNPKNLYFFCGSEYGVKVKYIDHLSDFYNGNKVESESVESVFSRFKKKQLVSSSKSVYVVRYDSEFISSLDDKLVRSLKEISILGTLVCLYEDESAYKKLDKFFPENVVRFDLINSDMIQKYLIRDFPSIDKTYIQYASQNCRTYNQANEICSQVLMYSNDLEMSKSQFLYSFGLSSSSSEDEFRIAFSARNFSKIVEIIDNFDGDLNYLLNCICNTMIELDKVICSSYLDSPLKKYSKLWSVQDIYYMFNHTYNEINRIRSNGISNVYDSLIYLSSLLRFKPIPTLSDVI